ncbi:hypothetical protein [Desulfitobacterium metallireducens]|uniref:DUF4181 domain-containing protein n=1 Tax=Desulfitobacterium metallireducens DSM 15288 TaxID=871968 RepID=W0EC24_9FIRM|nr:hypothetical protein [Desulfitobacterium metallireducens]AHF08420.1 hypothetical protein DESME_02315 [Desulfitobacterium metallireducens DSM 15288]
MPDYFYLTILCVGVIIQIILLIYLFVKGKYYPYFGRDEEDSLKKRIFDIGLNLVIVVSATILSFSRENTELLVLIFFILLIAIVLCVNILNYLSYRKMKDPKIIWQTVTLDLSIIALFLIIKYILP